MPATFPARITRYLRALLPILVVALVEAGLVAVGVPHVAVAVAVVIRQRVQLEGAILLPQVGPTTRLVVLDVAPRLGRLEPCRMACLHEPADASRG